MAKPKFAPGVVVDVKHVGPAGEKLHSERVEIGCGDGEEAHDLFRLLLHNLTIVKELEEA